MLLLLTVHGRALVAAHFLKGCAHVIELIPNFWDHIDRGANPDGQCDAVGWPCIHFHDFAFHDFILSFQDQTCEVNAVFKVGDCHPGNFCPKSIEHVDHEVMRLGSGRGLPGKGEVDCRADCQIDVKHDHLTTVSKKHGTPCRGGQQGDGFHSDQVGHMRMFVWVCACLKERVTGDEDLCPGRGATYGERADACG